MKAFANIANFPSNVTRDFLYAIVHSSQTIGLHFCNTFPLLDVLEILHAGLAMNFMFIRNFRAGLATVTSDRNVAAIPDDA